MTDTGFPPRPGPDREQLARPVLGEPPRYTSRQVAAAVGVPMHRARRFWRALGYANVEDTAVEFTDSDVQALRVLVSLVTDGLLEEPQAVQLTRLLGRAAARLAASQVELVLGRLEDTGIGEADRVEIVQRLARGVTRDVEWLLGYAWRRQMGAAIHRLYPTADDAAPAVLAVGFADMVNFTRLSREISDSRLAELVERFEGRSADIIAECGGHMVKMLGDEMLFVTDEPLIAAEIATRIGDAFRHDREVPGVRIGMALGPVVWHLGDVFGTTVNLASRLTAIAEPGSILLAEDLAAGLAGDARFEVSPIGARTVRGIGEVVPCLLKRAAPTG